MYTDILLWFLAVLCVLLLLLVTYGFSEHFRVYEGSITL